MLLRLLFRLGIVFFCVVGAWCWSWALPWLEPYNASTGITLGHASAGVLGGLFMLLIFGLPVMVGAVFFTSVRGPLTGIFILSFSLMVIGVLGGGIDGFLWRSTLPSAYGGLTIEALGWAAGVIGFFILLGKAGPALRKHLPGPMKKEKGSIPPVNLLRGGAWALLSGMIAAGIGGFLTSAIIQSSEATQAAGALVLAFAIGGLIGQLIMPRSNPVVILISPLLVAVVGYIAILFQQDATQVQMMAQFYSGELSGMVLALPIHYASAGVLGACIGVGFGQSLEQARLTELS